MRKISTETKDKINRLYSGGKSAREVARMVSLHHSTVLKYLPGQKAGEEQSLAGRRLLLSPRVVKHVVRRVESGKVRNAKMAADDLENDLGIKVSRWTIARSLRSAGLKSYSKPKKPRLLTRHRVARLRFCRDLRNYTNEDWQRVIFTDESRICLYGPDSDRRVWRRPGSQLRDHHVTQTVKFGGMSLMVWGAITYKGVGKLVFIEGTMNAAYYVEILRSGYAGTLDFYGLNVSDTVFQQDNDPKHNSRTARAYIESAGIRAMEWPSCSPDLNIIEHVWGYLKRRLAESPSKPQNRVEFKAKVEELWNSIPVDYIKALYDSLPRRLEELRACRGGYTHY